MITKIKPNHITGFGLTLVPFMVISQQMGGVTGLLICLILILLREGTDIADGSLARYLNEVTNFGKLLDPLVDSLARFSIFLGFLASGWMPLWMVVVIFARDIIVAYTRAYAATFGIVIAARPSGKYIKAIPQAVSQIVTVFLYLLVEYGLDVPAEKISWALLFIATAATASTAFDYVFAASDQIMTKKKMA